MDHDFCDMVVDVMLMHTERISYAPVDSIFQMFDLSAPHAPVRKLLGDAFVFMGRPGWLKDTEGSAEAHKEIAKHILERGTKCPRDAPWRKDACVYHRHKEHGEICYKDKVEWGEDIVVSACLSYRFFS